MSRLLIIDNCMDCKHLKLIGNINTSKGYDEFEDIYYCIHDIDNDVILFKFNESDKRTKDNFNIPFDKCKLDKYNDDKE